MAGGETSWEPNRDIKGENERFAIDPLKIQQWDSFVTGLSAWRVRPFFGRGAPNRHSADAIRPRRPATLKAMNLQSSALINTDGS
jgi:hypothetical protein